MNSSTTFTTKSTQLAHFSAAPGDLRRIVLDYLFSKCYVDTAQAFARESFPIELDADGDEIIPSEEEYIFDSGLLRHAQYRKEIKLKLLAGNVSEAIGLLNVHFPTVLSSSSSTPLYDPAHLILNLRIQCFIEQARTIPLSYPSSPVPSSTPHLHSPVVTPISASFPPEDPSPERKSLLLNEMLALHRLAHDLPSQRDRKIYIAELNHVGGLLAYPVPEKSKELRRYLDMRRREAVAEQINDAILYRLNHPIPAFPDLVAQHTTVIFATLNQLGKRFPSKEQCPKDLVKVLQGASPRNKTIDGSVLGLGGKGMSKEVGKEDDDALEAAVVPSFDIEMLLKGEEGDSHDAVQV